MPGHEALERSLDMADAACPNPLFHARVGSVPGTSWFRGRRRMDGHVACSSRAAVCVTRHNRTDGGQRNPGMLNNVVLDPGHGGSHRPGNATPMASASMTANSKSRPTTRSRGVWLVI